MSIPLFFNTVTFVVSAQFVMTSESFIAAKIKQLPFQPLFWHKLEFIICQKSVHEDFSLNL